MAKENKNLRELTDEEMKQVQGGMYKPPIKKNCTDQEKEETPELCY